jgi:hypothetical protein
MRNRFKLLVHESTGQTYEDLFVKIMSYHDVDFKPVKPHGKIGDRGNDGWNSKSGRYYQVYAPEDLFKNTEKATIKLNEDFDKLKLYWDSISSVREFIFVVNDKFKGVSPHITKAITALKDKHKLLKVEILLSGDLENILFNLNQEQISQVLGGSSKGIVNFTATNVEKNLEMYSEFKDINFFSLYWNYLEHQYELVGMGPVDMVFRDDEVIISFYGHENGFPTQRLRTGRSRYLQRYQIDFLSLFKLMVCLYDNDEALYDFTLKIRANKEISCSSSTQKAHYGGDYYTEKGIVYDDECRQISPSHEKTYLLILKLCQKFHESVCP